jgi:hypothetical protein
MADLSPAAQAVLDAYQLAPIEDELTAAAVLRAAALYCTRERRILMAIAAELEATAMP